MGAEISARVYFFIIPPFERENAQKRPANQFTIYTVRWRLRLSHRVNYWLFLHKFQPNARVVENKNRKFEFFFIACPAGTYVKNAAYNFVDFRIKPAGSSNYGGPSFGRRQKSETRNMNIEILNKHEWQKYKIQNGKLKPKAGLFRTFEIRILNLFRI